MDAIQTDRDVSYFDQPPVLLAASSDAAMHRGARAIEAAGMRIADRLSIGSAAERIQRQISAAAVWLELDEDCGGPMDELLGRVTNDVASGRYAAIVSATGALLDPVAARVSDHGIELIVDADEAERVAALAIAMSQRGFPARVADAAADKNAARLRQLSDEVGRIAATLARLSTGPAPAKALDAAPPPADLPAVSAETVRSVIRARRMRARYFPEDLFADPAWDMLLDLFQAEIAQLRVPVSSLCIAAAVPATTALRWLKAMTSQGLFLRRADPHDGRRVFVELAPEASNAMRRYFAEVGVIAVV